MKWVGRGAMVSGRQAAEAIVDAVRAQRTRQTMTMRICQTTQKAVATA